MKQTRKKMPLVLAGTLLFNLLFWNEQMGINTFLFDVFLLWSVFYLYPGAFSGAAVRWLLAAHLITLAAVILLHTELSKLSCVISLLLLGAFTEYQHRSPWYAAGSVSLNFLLVIPSLWNNVRLSKIAPVRLRTVRKISRIVLIPVLITVVFIMLYTAANSVFNDMVVNAGVLLRNCWTRLFDWFSWKRWWFTVLGVILTGGLLLKSNAHFFVKKETCCTDNLERKRNQPAAWSDSVASDLLSLLLGRQARSLLALKNENVIGVINLLLLNGLLCCINVIDIIYVWFGFSYNSQLNLSEYVHEGTWLLIFSIVLAMLVLLFFFRGNLNFYQRNKWLKYGAYAWIAQNSILVVSVFLRDSYYIAHRGLAYKRLGVLFFLVLVIAGLITVFLKIRYKKTVYCLLRINAWVVVTLLVVSSCVQWDAWIASYNLSRKHTIELDVPFLLSLSDSALPVIEQNKEVLTDRLTKAPADAGLTTELPEKEIFEWRKRAFFQRWKSYSWLSWNWSDWHTAHRLATLKIPLL